ncbi:hypothetical protein [Pontibacter mangrovi]|uniref:Uncharacterized protein n=1 Tax=Pontibacter mangrovi TaxID=2589816 RepID=A0A501W6Y7_9BACT|nr:hypothetical protein [Pontibacter mangrovi]TPE44502.1 hypothetical protein FJM65_10210 [Pontibacter mangrovi]
MKKALILLGVVFSLVSCSDEQSNQDEGELLLSKRLGAEEVQMSFNYKHSAGNDEFILQESYLSIDVCNSAKINKIKHNERLFQREAEKLKSLVVDSMKFEPQMEYDELRINFIDRKDFLFFKKEDTKTVTYHSL